MTKVKDIVKKAENESSRSSEKDQCGEKEIKTEIIIAKKKERQTEIGSRGHRKWKLKLLRKREKNTERTRKQDRVIKRDKDQNEYNRGDRVH